MSERLSKIFFTASILVFEEFLGRGIYKLFICDTVQETVPKVGDQN